MYQPEFMLPRQRPTNATFRKNGCDGVRSEKSGERTATAGVRIHVCCFIPSSDLCRRLTFGRKRCASLSVGETSCLLPAARADRVRRSTVVAGGRARYSEHVDPRFPSSSSSLLSSSPYVYLFVFFASISLLLSHSLSPSSIYCLVLHLFFLENIAIFKRKWYAASLVFDLWHRDHLSHNLV